MVIRKNRKTSLLLETALNNATKTKDYQAWIEAVHVADRFKESKGALCSQ